MSLNYFGWMSTVNKKALAFAKAFCFLKEFDYLLTVFFKSAPALNFATFLAAILSVLPV